MRRPSLPQPQAGFALTDVVVGMTVLSLVALSTMGIFLAGFTQARTAGVHAGSATWVQGEIEALRGLGYGHACLGAGTRTVTPGSAPCHVLEPGLPVGLAQATLQVEDDALGRPGLKRLTIEVFRYPGDVFYRMVTYVTEFQ